MITNAPGAVIPVNGMADVLKLQFQAQLNAQFAQLRPDEQQAEEFFGPDRPAWYELRFPWETQPAWWRLLARAKYRNLHESILRRERDLGITMRQWSVLPWCSQSY